jgi:hypothetical protein
VLANPAAYYRACDPPVDADVTLAGDETIDLAGIDFETSRCPGHSPGHLAFYADGALFSGDVLFAGSVGRTDLPMATGTRSSSRSARSSTGSRRDRRLLRPRPADDARRRARAQPVPRRAARRERSRPRGHPRHPPVRAARWRQVKREFERLCALYGYRRIDTPVFEDTELFARTSGEGSDVVTKEMYTFTDRGDRSLTLRPEATAPIVPRVPRARPAPRAAAAEALHDRADVPLRPPAEGPLPRALAARLEAIGSDDPASTPR